MTSYYKETISGLVDEIMADWAEYLPNQHGAHSQVFYDKEDGTFWHKMSMMNTWVEYQYSYSIVEIANVTRPDDFAVVAADADNPLADPEYTKAYLFGARDEVEGAIRDGMESLGI